MTQPELPPEQDAVRRLLADARHDEPVPPAVAARLDDVLAELTADRREGPGTAPVVDLATRRRRSAGTALLVAAAVVVAGVGIGQVVGGSTSMDSAGSTATGGGDGAEDSDSAESAPLEEDGAGGGGADSSRKDSMLAGAAPAVSTDTLRRDLRAAQRAVESGLVGEDQAPDCAVPAAANGGGRSVPVLLDGEPGLAVYRVPQGERRRVEVYLCGTGESAAATTIPAR